MTVPASLSVDRRTHPPHPLPRHTPSAKIAAIKLTSPQNDSDGTAAGAAAAIAVAADAAVSVPSGSGVGDVTEAVFEIPVGGGLLPIATRRTKLAVPGSMTALEQVTVPVAPTAGVVQVKPAGGTTDTKVVPAGRTSAIATAVALLGPAFVTWIV